MRGIVILLNSQIEKHQGVGATKEGTRSRTDSGKFIPIACLPTILCNQVVNSKTKEKVLCGNDHASDSTKKQKITPFQQQSYSQQFPR